MTEHRAAIQVRPFVEGAQYGYADVTDGGAAKVAGSAADRVVRRAVADAVDLTDHDPNDVIGEVAVTERDGEGDGLRVTDLQFHLGGRE